MSTNLSYSSPSAVHYVIGVHGDYVDTVRDILGQSTVNGTFGQYKILSDSLTITGMFSIFLLV